MSVKLLDIKLPLVKSTKKIDCKIYPITEYVLHFDGCSKGNPGHSGIGAVIYESDKEYWFSCKYIGNNMTNNESEYYALIFGLESALQHKIYNLTVCGDSLLVINQVNGIYKVKNERLFGLYDKVMKLKSKFTYIDFNHVYRNKNKRADELSNLALEFMEDEYKEADIINYDIGDEIITYDASSKKC